MENMKMSISALFDVALHLPHNFSKDGMQIIPKYEADLTIGELGQESINISEVESFTYAKDYVSLKMQGGTEVSLTEDKDVKIFTHKEVINGISCKKLAYIKDKSVLGQAKFIYKDITTMKMDNLILTTDSEETDRTVLNILLDKATDNLTEAVVLSDKMKNANNINLANLLEQTVYQLSEDGSVIKIV